MESNRTSTTMTHYYWKFKRYRVMDPLYKYINPLKFCVSSWTLYNTKQNTAAKYKWKDPFTVHFNVSNITFIVFFSLVFCVPFAGTLLKTAANRNTKQHFIIYALSTRMHNDQFSWKEIQPYRMSARTRVGWFWICVECIFSLDKMTLNR